MTSFAFIMGVLPLVMATGAGAEMRHAMGVAVFSGMLGVTLFGLFLTPCSMCCCASWRSAWSATAPAAATAPHVIEASRTLNDDVPERFPADPAGRRADPGRLLAGPGRHGARPGRALGPTRRTRCRTSRPPRACGSRPHPPKQSRAASGGRCSATPPQRPRGAGRPGEPHPGGTRPAARRPPARC